MTIDKKAAQENIIEIASGLIAEGGSSALKAREIAKRAGVSVGSVYNMFGDLDDLHRVVNLRLLEELETKGRTTVQELAEAGTQDVTEQLLALSRTYLNFVVEHETAWAALLSFNRSQRGADTPDWYYARLETMFQIIANVLTATTLKHDDIRRTVAARALWSAVHGIVTNGYNQGNAELLTENIWSQIELLVSIFIKGLDAVESEQH